MNLLLDTHAFLWWDNDRAKLSTRVKQAIESADNTVHLSMASIWELQIKSQLGKLMLRLPLPQLILDQEQSNGLHVLAVEREDIFALESLPPLHRDPFDRIIAAQALRGDYEVITHDDEVRGYGVKFFW